MEKIESIAAISPRPWPLFRQRWALFLPSAALLSAAILWGGSFPAMRVAVSALGPAAVMWIRMAMAFVLLLPFAGKLIPKEYRAGDWKYLIPMVLCQPCLYFMLEANALRYTTSSQAGVVAASVPVLVGVGAWLFLSEKVTRITWTGLFVSMASVVGLTLLEKPGGAAENALLGNALELLAMMVAALNMILIKGLTRRYSPWSLTAMQVVAGVIFFLPGLQTLPQASAGVWNMKLLLVLGFLGSFVTLGAFGFYNWGMSRVPASRASVFINLVPVNAVAMGWLFLGESLSLPQCLVALSVIGGVCMSQKGRI